MKKLGYPATWGCTCFIDGGCGTGVFAHTNGDGDFVLFDELGHPWPIHECYQKRSIVSGIQQSDNIDYSNIPKRVAIIDIKVDQVQADSRNATYNVLGTVTSIKPKALSQCEEFRNLSSAEVAKIKKLLAGRSSLMTIEDVENRKFTMFFDYKKYEINSLDIVSCRIKTKQILNEFVFVVSSVKYFHSSSGNKSW